MKYTFPELLFGSEENDPSPLAQPLHPQCIHSITLLSSNLSCGTLQIHVVP